MAPRPGGWSPAQGQVREQNAGHRADADEAGGGDEVEAIFFVITEEAAHLSPLEKFASGLMNMQRPVDPPASPVNLNW